VPMPFDTLNKSKSGPPSCNATYQGRLDTRYKGLVQTVRKAECETTDFIDLFGMLGQSLPLRQID
ncbi:hypothetical protein, partial [Methylobacterium indicum]|uniref:hypothetical protein n=1 Tax=Methylobacterium indicum TaxID=1775910 RepID=UPI000B18E8A8